VVSGPPVCHVWFVMTKAWHWHNECSRGTVCTWFSVILIFLATHMCRGNSVQDLMIMHPPPCTVAPTLRVKVMTRMELGLTPCWRHQPTRAATTRVLPLPGPGGSGVGVGGWGVCVWGGGGC
jgi:hypothetical protein